jgi:hypothetical protein
MLPRTYVRAKGAAAVVCTYGIMSTFGMRTHILRDILILFADKQVYIVIIKKKSFMLDFFLPK